MAADMEKKSAFISVVVVVVAFLFLGWRALYLGIADMSRVPGGTPAETSARPSELQKPHFVGVVSRFAPAVTYETYQPLIDYLNRVTPHNFSLRLGSSYEETVEQLASQEVIAAFLGSYIFVRVRDELPIQPLLRPLNRDGEPSTRSALVVQRGGPVKSIDDLGGRSLALPSPASFSGNWLTRMTLKEHGMSVHDLAEVQFFDYHHTVIFEVLWGHFDAGVVRESVAQEYVDKGIEVLSFSPAFSGAPLVVHEDAPPGLVKDLEEALLGMPTSFLEGLAGELANGFVEARNENYDPLEQWVDRMDEERDPN